MARKPFKICTWQRRGTVMNFEGCTITHLFLLLLLSHFSFLLIFFLLFLLPLLSSSSSSSSSLSLLLPLLLLSSSSSSSSLSSSPSSSSVDAAVFFFHVDVRTIFIIVFQNNCQLNVLFLLWSVLIVFIVINVIVSIVITPYCAVYNFKSERKIMENVNLIINYPLVPIYRATIISNMYTKRIISEKKTWYFKFLLKFRFEVEMNKKQLPIIVYMARSL